ncbi:MAG TPA: hypothetical protein P5137_00930 [Candidatus Brocadiia bacterium]|nr:hypothetical protein [Candidatus Brocadiia bacterium]
MATAAEMVAALDAAILEALSKPSAIKDVRIGETIFRTLEDLTNARAYYARQAGASRLRKFRVIHPNFGDTLGNA